jgi:hypothetical protein
MGMTTSWIWADEASGGVKGARLDLTEQLIEWLDQPGCACGDATSRQTFGDFLSAGPLESPPADVVAEMRQALSIDSARARR